jgi:small-conductance mechanosensitive channel
MIRIPNSDIFNKPLANYSKGFNYNWFEIPVVVTYESDWRKTKQLLSELISNYCKSYEDQLNRELKSARQNFPINYTYTTPTIYTSSLDHGICLTIRYLVSTRKIRESSHELWESILELSEIHDDIDLAYPTIRHLND